MSINIIFSNKFLNDSYKCYLTTLNKLIIFATKWSISDRNRFVPRFITRMIHVGLWD